MDRRARIVGRGGRKTTAVDFTDGAGLDRYTSRLLSWALCRPSATRCAKPSRACCENLVAGFCHRARKAIDELWKPSADLMAAGGYGSDRVEIEPIRLCAVLAMYTGPVLRPELTFEIKDIKGACATLALSAGGGALHDLVKRFTGQEVPATGLCLSVSTALTWRPCRAKGDVSAPKGRVVLP